MRLAIALIVAILLATGCVSVRRESSQDSDNLVVAGRSVRETVDCLAQPLVDSGRNIGMVIAVSTPEGDELLAYGSEDPGGMIPLSTDALFQVGSVSKSFAALLAAELEKEHRLKVDDPVGKLIPADIAMASPDLRQVTLVELASHTSGMVHEAYTLDLLWGAMTYLVSGKNLYRFYDTAALENYVSTQDFKRPTQKKYAYSNIGFTYMGWLLGQVDRKGYPRLLREKILDPLGLAHTGLCLRDGGGPELTPGYAGDLPTFVPRHTPVDPWLFDSGIAAPGGVYSTAADLLTYAKYNLGVEPTPLYDAMVATHQPQAPAEGGQIAMSWFIKTLPGTGLPYASIDGIAGGHTSFLGFEQQQQVAVVVLQNSINHDDMIGAPLLDRLVGREAALHENSPPPGNARLNVRSRVSIAPAPDASRSRVSAVQQP